MEKAGLAASQKNGGGQVHFVFLDESGFSEGSVIRRTWAPRGQTPVLRTKMRSWKRMSAIGALAYRRDGRSRVLLRFHPGEVRTHQVLVFLKHLLRHLRGKVVLIWDGLQAHRALPVRAFVESHPRLEVVRLPAYAPELNPVEGLWGWIKGTCLANVCEETLAPVVEHVRSGVRRLRRRRALPWAFLSRTGISL